MDKVLFDLVNTKLAEKDNLLIAIEGSCASGKTTLSKCFEEKFDCNIIHMDDFFLPFEKRSEERMKEIGGNIDYERFFNEVVSNIKNDVSFSYGKFSCSEGKINETIELIPKKLTVIEGVYSMHPKFGDAYDLKIFIDIDEETQLKRLKNRSPEKLERFIKEWIPMENSYFEKFGIKEKCDIVLVNY